jgi:hypothetical protein
MDRLLVVPSALATVADRVLQVILQPAVKAMASGARDGRVGQMLVARRKRNVVRSCLASKDGEEIHVLDHVAPF